MQALAADAAAQDAVPSSSQEADVEQAADASESSSEVSQEQGESEGAISSDEDAQSAPDSVDEEASSDGPQANATRGSPEVPAARKANVPSRAPASGSIITSASLSTTHFNNNGTSSQLTMGFSLPNGKFSAGDTSTIQFPEGFKFVADYDFDVKSSDGATVARAHMDAQAGTMTLTYTNYVESHSDITGTITASVTTKKETIGDFGKKQFNLTVDGTIVPVGEVDYEKWTGDNPDEAIAKWGSASNSADRTISYTIRVNGAGQNISDAVVSDTLKSTGMSYVEDSFTITRGTISLNPDSGAFEMAGGHDVTDQFSVEFSLDKTSFSINLGDIGTDGFYIRYKVKLSYDPANQEQFRNTVTLTGSDGTIDNGYDNTVVWQTASGEANGYNYSIAIEKTDESGAPLAGAVFSIVRDSTGAAVGTITTAADGTGSLGGLLRDAYTIRETTPPAGYTAAADVHVSADDLDNDAKTVHVTITDEPVKTSVKVDKRWIGPAGSVVTVGLLADGEDTGQTLTLDEANNWSGEFSGLRQYNADGTEIAYSVTEAQVSGVDASKYATTVTGDAAAGFTITNTNTETVDVSGAKTWNDDDDRDGMRPESITVNLLADGTEVAEQTVTARDGWAYSFNGLAKYSASDGHEIVYTVTEDAVANYATTISGTAIANSYTPGKTSVTVNKAWTDANNQDGIRPDSVLVQLYADDVASGAPVVLSAGNGWTYTWTDLFQKEAGRAIVYTVQEVDVAAGYTATVTGDDISGFTVTNTHEPEVVSVPVTKKWVGGEESTVTIRLLANGVDTGKTVSLSKDGDWTGSFSDLPKFEDGTQIVYTVAEDAINGYTSEISGDATGGFTVTNTKVDVPGKPGGSRDRPGATSSPLPKTGDDTTIAPAVLLIAALAVRAAGVAGWRRMSAASRRTLKHAFHLKR